MGVPEGWTRVRLGDVAKPRGEKWDPQAHPDEPFLGMDLVESHSMRILGFGRAGDMKSACARFEQEDVLYGRLRPYLNKVVLAPHAGLASAEFIVIPGSAAVLSKFLACRLNAQDFVSFSSHLNEGDRPRVSFDQLEVFDVCLPHPVEQRAIVAKIESLFSELDQGVAQLEAVRAQLKRYRQSVLKAAFEGRLTAAWRDQRRRAAEAMGEALPTADDLLARIHAEREKAYAARLAEWERAVAEWEAAGGKQSGRKKPRKPAKLKDLPPLTPEELAHLPELPEGWVWCRLESLAVSVRNGLSEKPNPQPPGYPILRINAVRPCSVDMHEVRYYDKPREEVADYFIGAGDLLFTRYNGSIDLLGVCGMVREFPEDRLHPDKLIRVKLAAPRATAEYIEFAANCGASRAFVVSRARTTAGQTGVSGSDIKSIPVPVAPLDEQTEIVNEIDARLSVVDEVERTIAAALKQAEALRQSILKKAFEGRLLSEAELAAVRADPAYEPAEKLLARIRGVAAEQPKRAASKASRPKAAGVSIPRGERYRQAACAAYAVRRLASQPTFGRVQQMKYLYLVPHVVEQESHIHAERQAAGPLDPAIHKIESLAKKQGWFTVKKSGQRYIYAAGAKIDEACTTAVEVFGPGKARVDWLIDQFAKFDTERAELVATTFAVWNDLLIDGEEPTEAAIVAGVHGWHPDKVAKFPADRIGRCIKWLRDNNLVPTGTGPRTQMAEAGA